MRSYSSIQELHPINPLHVSNQTTLIINSNVNHKSNEQARLMLVLNPALSNERLCCMYTQSAWPNIHLSIYELHKKCSKIIFSSKSNEIHYIATAKGQSEIRYSIFGILYHTQITQITIEALLYQPLRFIIITFTRERNMILKMIEQKDA